jgi:hypothetical protein
MIAWCQAGQLKPETKAKKGKARRAALLLPACCCCACALCCLSVSALRYHLVPCLCSSAFPALAAAVALA